MTVPIAVVVPVWNGARFLAEALDSVRAQTLPPAEIIVIDDGSTDDSATIAQRYAGVRVLRQPNRGCAVARNAGVAAARCPLIAFLDQDDVWRPTRLATAHGVILGEAAPDFVVCAQQNFLTPGLDVVPAWVNPAMMLNVHHGFGTNSLMARASAFVRVGAFDPAHVPFDDTDWFVRALDLGLTCVHIAEPLVMRRIHERNLSGTMRGTTGEGIAMARILHASVQRRRTGRTAP